MVLQIATTADILAAATGVSMQFCINGQHAHADWALLPRRLVGEGTQIQFIAEIELSSSSGKLLLDGLAFFFMLLPVTILAIFVAIPNALAGCALHEFITFLAALRTQLLGWGPVCVVFVFRFGFTRRFAERHGAELLGSSRRCSILFR